MVISTTTQYHCLLLIKDNLLDLVDWDWKKTTKLSWALKVFAWCDDTQDYLFCCCLSKAIWGSNQICLLDSGFGYLATLLVLEKVNFWNHLFKKNGVGWSAGFRIGWQEHSYAYVWKDVGYQTVHMESNTKYPNTKQSCCNCRQPAYFDHGKQIVDTPKAKNRRAGSDWLHWILNTFTS